ncbi:MAG: DinB family protein [Chitinophagales bacterium]|nr:DinB family protein [Chitinophagales bacterium]MDW8420015.1 DinB family protein [Chitinophagales bacterium]
MTQAVLLASTFQCVRDLTLWYLKFLREVNPYQTVQVNGAQLNSIYWLTAHIAWAENHLLLQCCGGAPLHYPWLEHYKLGSNGTLHDHEPDMKDLLQTLKTIHERAMFHLHQLSDNDIEKPNPCGYVFNKDNSIRMMIQHSIRHEAQHAGHLSWWCKLSGIQTI